jgi:hypothetical protein
VFPVTREARVPSAKSDHAAVHVCVLFVTQGHVIVRRKLLLLYQADTLDRRPEQCDRHGTCRGRSVIMKQTVHEHATRCIYVHTPFSVLSIQITYLSRWNCFLSFAMKSYKNVTYLINICSHVAAIREPLEGVSPKILVTF